MDNDESFKRLRPDAAVQPEKRVMTGCRSETTTPVTALLSGLNAAGAFGLKQGREQNNP
jgi:hypothetical protein